jgi:3-deoxy-D-manno-octulosonate 8-phosphate phosphatase (KDO 8-P phosphatase)
MLETNQIKAVALDVDGVLTDGSFWWGPNGEEFKQFNFADVMGISLGRKAGLLFALISGEASPLVDRFAEKMGIVDVYKLPFRRSGRQFLRISFLGGLDKGAQGIRQLK